MEHLVPVRPHPWSSSSRAKAAGAVFLIRPATQIVLRKALNRRFQAGYQRTLPEAIFFIHSVAFSLRSSTLHEVFVKMSETKELTYEEVSSHSSKKVPCLSQSPKMVHRTNVVYNRISTLSYMIKSTILAALWTSIRTSLLASCSTTIFLPWRHSVIWNNLCLCSTFRKIFDINFPCLEYHDLAIRCKAND